MAICLGHLVLLERGHISFQLFFFSLRREGEPRAIDSQAYSLPAFGSWLLSLAKKELECLKSAEAAAGAPVCADPPEIRADCFLFFLNLFIKDLHSVGSNCWANRPIPPNTHVQNRRIEAFRSEDRLDHKRVRGRQKSHSIHCRPSLSPNTQAALGNCSLPPVNQGAPSSSL